MMWFNPEKYVQNLAFQLDTHDSNARMMISLLLGYPIALIYSIFVYKMSPKAQQTYLLALGLLLCFWNFSFHVIHMLIAIAFTYFILNNYAGTGFSVILVGSFNMIYLFAGYTTYLDYDGVISWTTPFCILILRLIGLAWDLYDGKKAVNQRSEYQMRFALTTMPGLLETFSFCFTPTAFLIGPQFPMRHYQQFIDQSLRPANLYPHLSERNSIVRNKKIQRIGTRLFMAGVYLALFTKFSPMFTLSYITTKEFLEGSSLFYKLTYMAAYAKICIFRYFIVWLIGEGACVLLGLGCTGRVIVTEVSQQDPKDSKTAKLFDSSGGILPSDYDVSKLIQDVREGRVKITEAHHTACANVSVVRFEMATNTDGFVSGHNINTNKWMLEYVYKRFRFLGNKYLSQLFTLIFLSLWHGFYSGYYINFFLEFITVIVEKDVLSIVRMSKHRQFIYETWPGAILSTIAGKVHLFYLLGTPLTCFTLLKFNLYQPVLNSTYWIGFIYLFWPLARPIFKMAFPRRRPTDESQSNARVSQKVSEEETNEEDPLDCATKLRPRARAAVDEGALDEAEEERSAYAQTAKFFNVTRDSISEDSSVNLKHD